MTNRQRVEIPIAKTPYRNTKVSADRSQGSIRELLAKYGVEDIQFTYRRGHGADLKFAYPGDDGHLSVYQLRASFLSPDDQGERQALRMLFHWMKSLMEGIEYGLTDFQTAWLPYQLVSSENGPITIAEKVLPQLRAGGTDIDPFRPALPEAQYNAGAAD